MSVYNKQLESYIIDGVKYVIGDKYKLCEYTTGNTFDKNAKVKKLYYPKGKAFILLTLSQYGSCKKVEIINDKRAKEIMNQHPEGINEIVYSLFFGKPKEI